MKFVGTEEAKTKMKKMKPMISKMIIFVKRISNLPDRTDVEIDEQVDVIVSEWMGYMLLYETLIYFYDPVEVEQDQVIEGCLTLTQSKENRRFMNIDLEYTSESRSFVKELDDRADDTSCNLSQEKPLAGYSPHQSYSLKWKHECRKNSPGSNLLYLLKMRFYVFRLTQCIS